MTTFKGICQRNSVIVAEISMYTGVEIPLVMNLFHYSRRLCHPDRPSEIDKSVFLAQLGRRFGITSLQLTKLIFDVVRIKDGQTVALEEFTKLLCIFCCKDLDVRIDFVFSVYDLLHNDQISRKEMTTLLKTAFHNQGDYDSYDLVKELIDFVVSAFDTDGDGMISLGEFREIVHKENLYVQLLGQVFPDDHMFKRFLDLIKPMTTLQVRDYFINERNDCLSEPSDQRKTLLESLYPVVLELP